MNAIFRNKLFIVLLLALALRLFFVFAYPQLPVTSDASGYDRLGMNIAQGRGFLNERGVEAEGRAPGYPLFLAGIYATLGHSYNYVRLFQVFFSMLSILLIYLLARDIFGDQVALISACIAGIYPPFISYSGLLLTECIFTTCLLLYLYLFLWCRKARSALPFILLGVLGGLTALIREVFIAFMVIYFFLAIFYFMHRLSRGILILLIAAAIIAPWTMRNYRVFNRFILISSQGSGVLWLASHQEDLLEWYCSGEDCKSGSKSMPSLKSDDSLLGEGLKNIKDHPFIYLKLCFRRFFRFWVGGHSNTFYGLEGSLGNYLHNGQYPIVLVKAVFLAFNSIIVLLGFYGIYYGLRRLRQERRELIALVIPILILTSVHFFLFSTLRYQVPIMPFVIIFASFAIKTMFSSKRNNINHHKNRI